MRGGDIIEVVKKRLTLNFLKGGQKMKDSNVKRKSFLIICNVLLTLLLLVTTAVTITLAINKFNLNIGGNINFQASEVQATISKGVVANGTLADSESKMQAITLTPGTDGATEKATWQNLVITFDGLQDVTITFTVTNNHTESNMKMTLGTTSTQSNNMTMKATIDGQQKSSVIIPANANSNDNSVECEITFHITDNKKSANIQNFAISCDLENTDEEIVEEQGHTVTLQLSGDESGFINFAYKVNDGEYQYFSKMENIVLQDVETIQFFGQDGGVHVNLPGGSSYIRISFMDSSYEEARINLNGSTPLDASDIYTIKNDVTISLFFAANFYNGNL